MAKCSVADENCTAPAAYMSGNGSIYTVSGTRARYTCYICGEPVCGQCSQRREYHKGKRRICNSCCEDLDR